MPRRPRERDTPDTRVLHILTAMKSYGMSVTSFTEAYFASTDHLIKSRVGWFFKHQGRICVFQAMIRSSMYAAKRRATATATAEIADTIKHDILQLVLRVCRLEIQTVARNPRSRVDPDKIISIDCAVFSFTEIQAASVFSIVQSVRPGPPDGTELHVSSAFIAKTGRTIPVRPSCTSLHRPNKIYSFSPRPQELPEKLAHI
jgi:hypothetical protein